MPQKAGEMQSYMLGRASQAPAGTVPARPSSASKRRADVACSMMREQAGNGKDTTQRKRSSPGNAEVHPQAKARKVKRGQDSPAKRRSNAKDKGRHKRTNMGATESTVGERKKKAPGGQDSCPETSQPPLKRLTGKQPDPRQSVAEEELPPDK